MIFRRAVAGRTLGVLLAGLQLTLPTSASAPGRRARVRFEATARVQGTDSLVVRAAIANEGADTVMLEIGADCPVLLRIYRDSHRVGKPAWDGTERTCFSVSRGLTLRPGARARFRRAHSLHEILGDSLPSGNYYFTTVFAMPASHLEIPSGAGYITVKTRGPS